MASRLSLYFSLLILLLATASIVSSAARHAPATSSKLARNGGMVEIHERFAKSRVEDNSMVHHRLLTGHEEMIGLHDYGDTHANHKHDPHHPLAVKGNNKELDG
ncbi:uncharacterized protein LOC111018956 [Momordica charantia]|uniref:Uncharacterized protein LOC111018956 n=1 Tax=Momordica charantia TaxID=3673 RepID=A0A6J1D9T4_MOMCH|nr:uncharacterized protein LOC111018956 [Momordica charantia]